MLKTLAAAMLTLLLAAPAMADVRITFDPGGDTDVYTKRLHRYQRTGERVVIDGACISACARFMSAPGACATNNGYFFMHGVSDDRHRLDRDLGIYDSRRNELPAAVALQYRYDAFSFGIERRGHRPVHLEPGVDIVYPPGEKGGFYKLLRVKATLLIPRCR